MYMLPLKKNQSNFFWLKWSLGNQIYTLLTSSLEQLGKKIDKMCKITLFRPWGVRAGVLERVRRLQFAEQSPGKKTAEGKGKGELNQCRDPLRVWELMGIYRWWHQGQSHLKAAEEKTLRVHTGCKHLVFLPARVEKLHKEVEKKLAPD